MILFVFPNVESERVIIKWNAIHGYVRKSVDMVVDRLMDRLVDRLMVRLVVGCIHNKLRSTLS